ncbi:signal recognition particle protein [Anaplasmataceae bacterium AB001_6]|nr:signal recognition particle protein [Anaplasmataceae bacterium AB001_6]
MFDSLTSGISDSLSKLKSRVSVSKFDLSKVLEEIHDILIDSDVSLQLADDLCDMIKRRVEEEGLLKQISPTKKIIDMMQEEISNVMGERVIGLKLNKDPSFVLLCGLQGAGKTTTTAKLALKIKNDYLEDNKNIKILLVSLDVVRLAAKKQLKVLAESIDIDFFDYSMESNDAIDITKKAVPFAKENGYDVVIFDTAGRLNVDEGMLSELVKIDRIINPVERILVLDAMLGQQAVKITKDFSKSVNMTGLIFTRIESDSRGGAILSICYMTGIPVKFFGTGEKINDLEVFNPHRIAGRILGMGDIESLMEKATGAIGGKDKVEALSEKVKEGKFDFDDLAAQFKMVGKLGGIKKVLQFIPGLNSMSLPINIEDSVIKKNLAIISSMTKKERKFPEILNGTRKQRISSGSGVSVTDINNLIQQFRQAKKIAVAVSKKGISDFNPDDIYNNLGNLQQRSTKPTNVTRKKRPKKNKKNRR